MSENHILATIEDMQITESDLDAYIANMPQEQQMYAAYPQFREHCLKQLLAYHLYAKMAEEEKMAESEEFKSLLEQAKKDVLVQVAINSIIKNVVVTEEEMKKYYAKNPEQFTNDATVRAKHILVDTEEKALDIIKKIKNNEISFEDAAKEYSSCPSREQGGDLGEFGKGQMVPEFDHAVFSASEGDFIGPVKTQFGYHIIRVESKKEALIMEYGSVKDQIHSSLLQKKQNESYNEKYNELYKKYVK